MKLISILRVKNQIQTIDECMDKLSQLCDEIVIVDNGSTDGTIEAYKKYPKITSVLHTTGFDEGRDKIKALDEAKGRKPDWILWIDADEVFEKHFTREVIEKYMSSKYNRITFRMCNFWLSKKLCRYDHEYYLYTLHPQRSMWKNTPETYFKNMKIHNGDIQGVKGNSYLSPYRLKHYGYSYREKIEEKIQIYLKADPDGSRDYLNTIDPDLPYKTYEFYEFCNAYVNFAYILFYKYALNILWIIERLRRKYNKLLK